MNYFRIIFIAGFLFISQKDHAQQRSTLKASVDKNKILIGEPFQLTLEGTLVAGAVNKFSGIDSIPHFEFLEKPLLDSSRSGGSFTIRAVYKLTSFDSGHWVIPSFVLSPGIRSDTIPIDVRFSEFDPNQDYHDIKDIIDVKPAQKKQWWWWAVGGGLVLLLLFYYLSRKKKPVPVVKTQAVTDPYAEAMGELEKLQKTKSGPKEFHTALTGIFRVYIFRRKGILSLQKTTDDLVLQLKSLELDKEQFDKLSQSLRLSDFVKFAKYVPSDADNRDAFEAIRNTIMAIEKSETKVNPPGGGKN